MLQKGYCRLLKCSQYRMLLQFLLSLSNYPVWGCFPSAFWYGLSLLFHLTDTKHLSHSLESGITTRSVWLFCSGCNSRICRVGGINWEAVKHSKQSMCVKGYRAGFRCLFQNPATLMSIFYERYKQTLGWESLPRVSGEICVSQWHWIQEMYRKNGFCMLCPSVILWKDISRSTENLASNALLGKL